MRNFLKKTPNWFYFIFFLCVGLAVGFPVGEHQERTEISKAFHNIKQVRLPNEEYPLVSRLIGSEIPSATTFGIYNDLHDKIKNFIDSETRTTPLDKFSFYFRDLNTGLWFGLNENDEYVPASLFKLPIAMTYYKESMDDQELLNKRYTYTKEIDSKLDTQIGLEKSSLSVGDTYTVSELIKKMLVDSDNGAKNLLTENINVSTLNSLFNLVQLPGPAQNNYYISPREYAFFLRILYNGTYLGQSRSQEILNILSKASFNGGIGAAIPADIPVIHKFGSLNLIDKETNQKQLGFNDCGIVYYPQKPFILCFMATGGDQRSMAKDVEKVTGYIMNYIQNN